MTIYFDDQRDYTEIVEKWIRNFISTMDEGILRPGDDSGEAPPGIKIIFDGYGDLETEDEDGEYVYEEGGNHSMMSFAVFVHKDSLTKEFPPHDLTPWALIHRPKEECCIWAWYDEDSDEIDIIPFEDNNSTEMDPDILIDIINKIDEKLNEI